jgi:hypothetical protein
MSPGSARPLITVISIMVHPAPSLLACKMVNTQEATLRPGRRSQEGTEALAKFLPLCRPWFPSYKADIFHKA